jgi:F420-non-reducing hydrogenase small subunit
MSKPKVAFYWCASCGGCEEAVVDLGEVILDVVQAVEIVLWPVALDFKLEDVQAYRSNEIAVSFINGAVRNSEHGWTNTTSSFRKRGIPCVAWIR